MGKALQGTFQGYSKGVDAEVVRAAFVRKYGSGPAEVHDAGGCWLAGPIGAGGQIDHLLSVGDLDIMAEQLALWAPST